MLASPFVYLEEDLGILVDAATAFSISEALRVCYCVPEGPLATDGLFRTSPQSSRCSAIPIRSVGN